MHYMRHLLAQARFYATEDLKIAQGIGIYEDVMDTLEMLAVIELAEEVLWADNWNDDMLDIMTTIRQFVADHS